MLALIFALTFGLQSPDILKVPVVYAQEIDAKSRYIDALAECESHASTTVKVLDVNNQFSFGKYQWQMKSWLRYTDLGATRENILDEKMQDKITRHVLDNGGWRNWYNCSKRISASLGEYPL